MTAEKRKRGAQGRQGKYLQIALVVAASAAWLTYAVLVWRQRAGRFGDGSWADRLCGLFSNKGGVTTCMIYLSQLPGPVWRSSYAAAAASPPRPHATLRDTPPPLPLPSPALARRESSRPARFFSPPPLASPLAR